MLDIVALPNGPLCACARLCLGVYVCVRVGSSTESVFEGACRECVCVYMYVCVCSCGTLRVFLAACATEWLCVCDFRVCEWLSVHVCMFVSMPV